MDERRRTKKRRLSESEKQTEEMREMKSKKLVLVPRCACVFIFGRSVFLLIILFFDFLFSNNFFCSFLHRFYHGIDDLFLAAFHPSSLVLPQAYFYAKSWLKTFDYTKACIQYQNAIASVCSPQDREKRSASEMNTMKCTSQGKHRNRSISFCWCCCCYGSVLCSRKKARSMENEKKEIKLISKQLKRIRNIGSELNMSTVCQFFSCSFVWLMPND